MYNKLIYKGLVGENYMTSFDRTLNYIEFDKLKYIDELILKLQMLYSQNIVDGSFFDKAVELLNQEKMDISSNSEKSDINTNEDSKVYDLKIDIENMSPEEREKYLESEKQGIRMRLLEARNFSNLNILYERISKNINNSSKDFLKKEFTNNFEKIFEKSYIYYLIKDYGKKHGKLDLNELAIVDDKLILKNGQYECEINKALCKRENILYLDDKELASFKAIINKYNLCFAEEFIEYKLKNIIKLPEIPISFEERIEKIKKTIEKILNRDENRFFRSMISIESDFKFKDKLQKCKNTYNNDFKTEIPLLIFDNTIFKTCENGFIVTNKNLYLKDNIVRNINIDEIDTIELDDQKLQVNDDKVYCDIIKSNYREQFKDTMLIITYLIQNGKDESKKIDKVIKEVLYV